MPPEHVPPNPAPSAQPQSALSYILLHRCYITAIDTVEFGNGISFEDLEIVKEDYNLRINIVGQADSLLIHGWFSKGLFEVDQFRFADNSTLTAAQFESKGRAVYGTSSNDTLTGTNKNDQMFGYDGDDTLNGNEGDDVIDGGTGNDSMQGGVGADTMIGGSGNDSYVVDNAGDIVTEYTNQGTDAIESSIDYTLSTNVENLTLSGSSDLNGTGNEQANTIKGNSGDNTLYGNAGNDSIEGAAGHDFLDGGEGADTMKGGLGDDYYVVDNTGDAVIENNNEGFDTVETSISYTLGDNVEELYLESDTASINGTGNALDNRLYGNDGDNILDGRGGADYMDGDLGNDTYIVDNIDDHVYEESHAGNDTVQSSVTCILGDNIENLALTGATAINGAGNALNNVMTGNSAANTLSGGIGNDTLNGGGGNDSLIGGKGNDIYTLGRGYGNDTIVENDTAAGNVDIAQFNAGIATDQLWFRHVGNNLEVSVIGTGDKMIIQNWYSGAQYHVEQFKSGDGKVLLDTQVDVLVNAMAVYTPPALGQTILPQNYQDTLAPVITANWTA